MRRLLFLVITIAIAARAMPLGTADEAQIRGQVDSLHREGEKNHAARQLAEAMNHYLAGLRISERHKLHEESCRIYIGIGNLYSSQQDYEMGLRFYKRALAIARQRGNIALQNRALNNLIGASCFAGHPSEGKRYYSMLAANGEKSTEYSYNLLMCQGLIAANDGHTAAAIGCYRRALDYASRHNLEGNYKESARSCLAQLYDGIGEKDSALVYLTRNEQSARLSRQSDLLIETLRQKASVLASMGHRDQALAYKEAYLALSDSLYSRDEFNRMKNAQFLYEAQKSEKAISALTEEKQHREQTISTQRQWLLTLAVGAVALAMLCGVIYRQKRQLRSAYNELFDRNQALISEQSRPTPADSAKAGNAVLTAEQREKLLAAIGKAMADTAVFCHCDFSIEKLAAIVGSNSRYVSEAINDGYGKNFRTFLNEYRIREAMKRLSDSENYGHFTIRAVSESVGYKSQTNFIAVFTKIAGMKPSIFQKISIERQSEAKK